MKLPVHETFFTFQGEGLHAGRAAFFIRLFGCPIKCSFCDSAGTWHPNYVPENVDRLEVSKLVSDAKATGAPLAVITGGEPAIFDLSELSGELCRNSIEPHIETSGAYPIKGVFFWITVSPKWAKIPLRENLARANEIKIIVENKDSISDWMDVIQKYLSYSVIIRLHPEWSKRQDPEILTAISNAVKAEPAKFRAGWQLHKLYNVDALDPRSRPLVPLGGNVANGY